MTLRGAASGGQSLFGIRLSGTPNTSSSERVGRFHPRMAVVSTPTETPVLDVDSAGAITNAGVAYKVSSLDHLGNESAAGPASARSAAITSKKVIIDTTDAPSVYGAVGFRIYRSHTREDASVTAFYWVGDTYDSTDSEPEDNVPITEREIDFTRTAPDTNGSGTESVNVDDQVAGPNYGFAFIPRSEAAIVADYGRIESDELSGAEGETESAPAEITCNVTIGSALRAGLAVPILQAGIGRYTTKQGMVSGTLTTDDGLTTFDEPTRKFVFETNETVRLPRSLDALDYPGGAVTPELGLGLMGTGFSFSVRKGQLVKETVNLVGLHHTLHGIGIKVSGSGTYAGRPYLMGERNDPTASTDALFLKIQTGPSAGVVICQMKIGSGSSYSATFNVYYDTADGKQRRPTNGLVPRAEAVDQNGVRLGLDDNEARYPLWLLFSGDMRDLATNDIFRIDPTMLVPGEGDSSYTGVRPLILQGPRFGPAHTAIYRGDTLIPTKALDYALTIPNVPVDQLGAPAYAPTDFDFAGKLTAEGKFMNRWTDRENDRRLHKNEKLEILIELQGDRILVRPGTRSTQRHLFSAYHPRCTITDVTNARSEGVNEQTVTWRASQPSSGPWGIFTAIGDIDWRDPL